MVSEAPDLGERPDRASRTRGPSSTRLFWWATATFAWTAGSLFLELPSREGLLGRIGWAGLLVAGPATVLLVIFALRRYSSEVAAQPDPGAGFQDRHRDHLSKGP